MAGGRVPPLAFTSTALRRLAVLSAVFAPARAERLMRLVSGCSERAAAEAGALADRPRAERLSGLARALRSERGGPAAWGGDGAHPVLLRLAREAAWRRRGEPAARTPAPCAPQTVVRRPAPPAPGPGPEDRLRPSAPCTVGAGTIRD